MYIMMVVFDGPAVAETAVRRLPRRFRQRLDAIVIQKGVDGKLTFHDVGHTPARNTIGGAMLGGVVGLLTGGTGLLLGSMGAIIGHYRGKKKLTTGTTPWRLSQIVGSLGDDTSLILSVFESEPEPELIDTVTNLGGELIIATLPSGQMPQQAEEAYATLLTALAEQTGGKARTTVPYPKIHIVINPVSGKDEPIINVLNDVFCKHGVQWDVSITHKFGDATTFARQAAEAGCDLVVGYGGDGTQHEIANGVIGTGVPMGVLPGGTGNGFGNELGIPKDLRAAVELLCTSYNQRQIDIVKTGAGYFIQRLFTGIEPEEQTSREDKNRYGTLAYLQRDIRRLRDLRDIAYTLKIDGEAIEVLGYKCYVVNSARAGTGLAISENFKVDDGMLDVFMLATDRKSSSAALNRFFNLDTEDAGLYYWRGQTIEIEAEPDQPVWTDGEFTGRTPVSMQVIPGGLTVVV